MRRIAFVAGLITSGWACQEVLFVTRWGFELHPGQGAVPLDAEIVLKLEGVVLDREHELKSWTIGFADVTDPIPVDVPFDVVWLDDLTGVRVIPRAPLLPDREYRVDGVDVSRWQWAPTELKDVPPACVRFSTSTEVRARAAVWGTTSDGLPKAAVSLVFSEPMDPDDSDLVTALTADGEEVGALALELDPSRPWVWDLLADEPIVAVFVPAGTRAASGATTEESVALPIVRVYGGDYAWWTRTRPTDGEADTLTGGCMDPRHPG